MAKCSWIFSLRRIVQIPTSYAKPYSFFSHSVPLSLPHRITTRTITDIQNFPFGCRRPPSSPSTLMEKCNVIFVLGAPGSGKGTLCAQLSQHLDYEHLSAGDLIRRERDTPHSEYGKPIAEAIRVPGAFVPSEITVELLRRAMTMSKKREFLIDAFPVSDENRQAWEAKMATEAEIPCVLYLEVPPEVSIERCLGRRRQDDTKAVLEKRWESYRDKTKPVIDYYQEKGLLRKLDGSQTPEEVFRAAKEILPVKGTI